METMLLGTFSLVLLIISVCCLYYKISVFGLICSIASIPVTCLTGYYWKEMLEASGKSTAFLGFNRYPLAVIILAVLIFAAFIVLLASIINIVKGISNK